MASTLKDGRKDGARFSVYLRPCLLEWLDAQAEAIRKILFGGDKE